MISAAAEFSFHIDDRKMADIHGETDWEQATFTIPPGQHFLEWEFEKDDDPTRHMDAAFLDQLVLTGYAGWILEHGIPAGGNPPPTGLRLLWPPR